MSTVLITLGVIMVTAIVVYATILSFLHYKLRDYSEFMFRSMMLVQECFSNKQLKPFYRSLCHHYYWWRRVLE